MIGNQPLVSVIIPIYNKKKYLSDLFTDLQNQIFMEYECILIDDGSTDGSAEICDDICNKDSRFTVLHIKNGGVSNARNTGMSMAKGKYITFIDADDRLYPAYLDNLYKCIIDNDADFVISGLEKYWTDTDKKEYVKYLYNGLKEKSDILSDFAQIQRDTGIFGYCIAKIFKREFIYGIRFDTSIKLAEDFDFYLKVYRKVNSFYFDNKCYYRYLQIADSSTSIIADDKIDYLSQLKIRLRYRQFLIDEGAYSGENRRIIDETISNYVYFVLFHSPIQDMNNNYSELKKLIGNEKLVLDNKTVFQKLILNLFKNNNISFIKIVMMMYRTLVKTVRKFRK